MGDLSGGGLESPIFSGFFMFDYLFSNSNYIIFTISNHNSFNMSHMLALAPFWNTFTANDKKIIRSLLFHFTKFILGIPLGARTKRLVSAYKLTEPQLAAEQHLIRFLRKLHK